MSLNFGRLTAENVPRIISLRRTEPSEFSEHSISYTRHWSGDFYRCEFAEEADCGVLRFTLNGHRYYTPPFGTGDHARATAAIRAAEPGRLVMGLLTEKEAVRYAAQGWIVFENGWGFDYVYRQSDLAELKGTRYQAKRNFCHRFEKAGPWHYGPLNRADALCVLAAWRRNKGSDFDEEAETEYAALTEDLKEASIGGVLYQGERPVAFALGERLSDQMLLVSYEKALVDVPGAYQMINREFARREGAGYAYLNRASADGHPALVKAKESYAPARRLRKFFAIDSSVRGTDLHIAEKAAEDVPQIVSLWQQVFGDDESFIRSVVETAPGFVVYDAKGLAAMGFALEREGARYVYALATRPDCRGRGLATSILETIGCRYPAETLALVPGEPALIPFYERRGFAVTSREGYVTMTCPEAPGYRVTNPMN